MSSILAVTLPFFALVLCGYVATWRGWLPESAIPGLNGFVLFFALPCMLFRFGMNTPLLQLLHPGLLAVYTASALLMVGLTVWVTRRGPVGLKDAAFGALVAAFPNLGFMGVPLLVGLLGQAAAGPVISAVLVDTVLTSSLCLALASAQSSRESTSGKGRSAALRQVLRGTLINPMPWAITLGALASYTGWRPPQVIDAVTRMLGDAASPVALFTIGAVLCRAGRHAHQRTPVARYLPVALLKLLLHPLLVWGLGRLAQTQGLAISDFQLLVLTLAAALPSASNVSILAERYGADNGRIARIIMASTVLAFFSFPLLSWWLQ